MIHNEAKARPRICHLSKALHPKALHISSSDDVLTDGDHLHTCGVGLTCLLVSIQKRHCLVNSYVHLKLVNHL